MGSRSKKHGLTGVKHRRPKSNVARRVRKTRLNERKKVVNSELLAVLKKTPEIS